MFRKYICCVALAAATFNANADCAVRYFSESDSVMKVIDRGGWTFNNYDQICGKLNKAHAALNIQGTATVLQNQSVAWAVIGVRDSDSQIMTNDFGGSNTQVNSYASMDKAEEILLLAINGAIENVNFDDALKSLAVARQKVRASYKK